MLRLGPRDRLTDQRPAQEPVFPAADGLLDAQEADEERSSSDPAAPVRQGVADGEGSAGDASEERPPLQEEEGEGEGGGQADQVGAEQAQRTEAVDATPPTRPGKGEASFFSTILWNRCVYSQVLKQSVFEGIFEVAPQEF